MSRCDRPELDIGVPKFLRDEHAEMLGETNFETDFNGEPVEVEADEEAEASIEARTLSGQLQRDLDEERQRERRERRERIEREREALVKADTPTEPLRYADLTRSKGPVYWLQLVRFFEWPGHEQERARWHLSERVWKRLRADYEREGEGEE